MKPSKNCISPQTCAALKIHGKSATVLMPLQVPIMEWIVDDTFDLDIHPFLPVELDYIDPAPMEEPQILI